MPAQRLGTAQLLFKCAQQMKLDPVWLTPSGAFAIMVDGRERYINLARSPLNSHASAGLAKNKYVARRILERHNLQNIPFLRPSIRSEAEKFLGRYGTVIAKPVTGSGAQDIHIITNRIQLAELDICRYLLEQYIAGKEFRYLVLDKQVIGVHRSEYGTSVSEDRPLQRISCPRDTWDAALLASSQRIADILDLKFAAVDYLIDASGRAYILEVNTTPGLKWFHAPSSGPVVDVAHLFLESVVNAMRSPQRSPVCASSMTAGLSS